MTFKHNKFSDSPVMRSLEKVAITKGLVKTDPVVKVASKKTNFSPTGNLTENILKLCSGLRMNGMNKYAEELESNLLNYKKAQNLYDVSKETGEDIVEFAHPEGSHKLEDVDSSEAVVEDILDRQEKIKKVVDKKPTGKLETTAQVINAVLIALGEETAGEETAEELEKKILEKDKRKNEIRNNLAVNLTVKFKDGLTDLINIYENKFKTLSSNIREDFVNRLKQYLNYTYKNTFKIVDEPTAQLNAFTGTRQIGREIWNQINEFKSDDPDRQKYAETLKKNVTAALDKMLSAYNDFINYDKNVEASMSKASEPTTSKEAPKSNIPEPVNNAIALLRKIGQYAGAFWNLRSKVEKEGASILKDPSDKQELIDACLYYEAACSVFGDVYAAKELTKMLNENPSANIVIKAGQLFNSGNEKFKDLTSEFKINYNNLEDFYTSLNVINEKVNLALTDFRNYLK